MIAWFKAKFDKNTFKQLKNYTGPEGQTIRAKFTEVRKAHDARIMERILDDVSAETGIPRNELYIETVSGHADAWKETAGLTLPEDRIKVKTPGEELYKKYRALRKK